MAEISLKLTFAPNLDVAKFNVFLGTLKQSLGVFGKDIELIDAKKLEKDLNAVEQEAKQVSSAVQGIASAAAGAEQKAAGLGGAFQFNQITQMAQTIGSAVNELAAPFVKLDTSVRNIGALGVTNLSELGNTFSDLSKTIPNSAAEIGDAVGEAIGSGIIKTGEGGKVATAEVQKFADTAAKLAVAGQASIGEAGKGIGSVLNSYGLSAESADRVSKTLFNTFNYGSVSVKELAQYMPQVTSVASSLGVEVEELGGAYATMTKQGLGASDVTTKLKAFMTEVQKPGAELKKVMDAAGLSVATLKKPVSEGGLTFQDFVTKLKATAEAGGKGTEIFGSVEAAAVTLSLGGDKAAGALEDLNGVMNDSEAVGKGFETQSEGVAIKAKLMQNAFEANVTSILNQTGSLGAGVTAAASVFGSLGGQITALAGLKAVIPAGSLEQVQKLGSSLLSIIPAGSLEQVKKFALQMLSTLLPSLLATDAATGATAFSFTSMWAAATGPIGIALGAFLAVGAALTLLYNNSESFRQVIDNIVDNVVTFGELAYGIFTKYLGVVLEVGKAVFDWILTPFKIGYSIVSALGEAFFSLGGAFSSMIGGSTSAGGSMNLLVQVFEFLGNALNNVKGLIAGFRAGLDSVTGTITGVIGALGKGDFTGAFDAFTQGGAKAGEAFKNGAKDSIAEDTFKDLGANLDKGLADGIKVKATIDVANSIPKLTKDLEDTQAKMKPLELKVSKGQNLTDDEQKQLDSLQKKAEETTAKIQQVAPDAVAGVKTVVTATGEMKQVYEVNKQKALELAEAQKKIGGAELQQKQSEYSQKLLQAVGIYEQQKSRLKEVATEAEKAAKAGDTNGAKKKIEEYNELKAKVEENGRLVVKGYTDGAKAGLLTKDATDKIEGAMNLTKGTAGKLLDVQNKQEAAAKSTGEAVKSIGDAFEASLKSANAAVDAQISKLAGLVVKRKEMAKNREDTSAIDKQIKSEKTVLQNQDKERDGLKKVKDDITATTTEKKKSEKASKSAFELAEATFKANQKLTDSQQKHNDLIAELNRLETGKKKTDLDEIADAEKKLEIAKKQRNELQESLKIQADGTFNITFKKDSDEKTKATELVQETNNAILAAQSTVKKLQLKLGLSDENLRQQLEDVKLDALKVSIEQDPSNRGKYIDELTSELATINALSKNANDELKADLAKREKTIQNQLVAAKKEQYKDDLENLKEAAKKSEELLKSTTDKELKFSEVVGKALRDTQKDMLTADKADKLKNLEALKTKELISEQEFNLAKEKLDVEFAKKDRLLAAASNGAKIASELVVNRRLLDLKKQNIEAQLALEVKNGNGNSKAADALREQLTEVDDAIAEKGDMTNVALGLLNETLSNSMNNLLSGDLEGVKNNFREYLAVIAGALEALASAAVIQLVFSPAQIANSSLLPFPLNLLGLGFIKEGLEQGIHLILAPILSSITSFSTGGVVTSPTLAWVGDRAMSRGKDNTELILGLDQVHAVIQKAYLPIMQGLESRFAALESALSGQTLVATVSYDALKFVMGRGQQSAQRRNRTVLPA